MDGIRREKQFFLSSDNVQLIERCDDFRDACISHGVGKLVYVSSVHALAEKPKGIEIDAETDAFDPNRLVGDYAKSKAMATHAVLDAAKTFLDASVVLPSGIIGSTWTA